MCVSLTHLITGMFTILKLLKNSTTTEWTSIEKQKNEKSLKSGNCELSYRQEKSHCQMSSENPLEIIRKLISFFSVSSLLCVVKNIMKMSLDEIRVRLEWETIRSCKFTRLSHNTNKSWQRIHVSSLWTVCITTRRDLRRNYHNSHTTTKWNLKILRNV